jgi:hypothetical protein
VESSDIVSINYLTQPHRYCTVIATTLVSADTDVVANVKPLELCLPYMELS